MTELERRFSNHSVNPSQKLSMEEIRTAASELADLIEHSTQPGRERAEAVKCVELATFWANASISRPPASGGRELTMATPPRKP